MVREMTLAEKRTTAPPRRKNTDHVGMLGRRYRSTMLSVSRSGLETISTRLLCSCYAFSDLITQQLHSPHGTAVLVSCQLEPTCAFVLPQAHAIFFLFLQ
jgi:hypothetical protein